MIRKIDKDRHIIDEFKDHYPNTKVSMSGPYLPLTFLVLKINDIIDVVNALEVHAEVINKRLDSLQLKSG